MQTDFGNRTGLPAPRTVEQLAERLEDAARTLRKLPSGAHSSPAGMKSNWPEFVRQAVEAYGYDTARGGRVRATAAEIGRLDECISWISRAWNADAMRRAGLPEDAGALAWLRCSGWQMRRLAEWRIQRYGLKKPPGGTSREAIRTLVQRALERMLSAITGQPVTPKAIDPEQPRVVWDVEVDFAAEARVAAILGDGQVLVRTRHARAEHREVPARKRRDD